MKKLNGSGSMVSIRNNIAKQFIAHQHTNRAHSFAAQLQNILCRIVQRFGMCWEMPCIKFFFKYFGQFYKRMHCVVEVLINI